jgi:hypothetical protein
LTVPPLRSERRIHAAAPGKPTKSHVQALLGPFYQLIVKSERLDLERNPRMFREEDEESAWSGR